MNENEEKLRVIAEDCKAVIEEAKSMGCNKVRALYNIPLENMELIVQALEKQIPKKPITHSNTNRADCPCCGATVRGIKNPFGDWCSNCGQKLDFGE